MVKVSLQQIASIILLNIIALWLTYGYLVAANPLTIKQVTQKPDCSLHVRYPELLIYGKKVNLEGELICGENIPEGLIAQALMICGELNTLTVSYSVVRSDGTFNIALDTAFTKPSTGSVQCSITVNILANAVPLGIGDKKTITMLVEDHT